MADAPTDRESVERIIRDAEAATDGCGLWRVGDYDTSGAVLEGSSVIADVSLIANAQRIVGAVLTLREAIPTLRALLAEKEAAEHEANCGRQAEADADAERDAERAARQRAEAERDAARQSARAFEVETEKAWSAAKERRKEATKLRRAWLRVIQHENQCPATGGGCLAKRCGCVAEMEMLIGEADHV